MGIEKYGHKLYGLLLIVLLVQSSTSKVNIKNFAQQSTTGGGSGSEGSGSGSEGGFGD